MTRPKIIAKLGVPRKSNASTPAPSDDVVSPADKLNYHDTPRPFKSARFISRLPHRTASSSTTGVRKSAKQVLVLERERVSGGDGFLSAAQVAQRARGEPIEVGKKKKGGAGASGPLANLHGGRKGNVQNFIKARMKNALAQNGLGLGLGAGGDGGSMGVSGVTTPMTGVESEMPSGTTTPAGESEEEGDASGSAGTGAGAGAALGRETNGTAPSSSNGEANGSVDIAPRKEVFTYHTPTAPPSLLPARKYCDITGLHAAYTDPRTKLRYKGLEVYHVVRELGPGSDQAYLALRGAQTSLK